MKKIATSISCVGIICFFAEAQSVYSFQGLGSLDHQGMPNNVGMGEVGIGSPTIWHVNTKNPANLVYNTFSTFQIGLEIDKRSFSGNDISGTDTDGRLRFLSYAFPIKSGKWSSSFGILPYSNVSYNTFSIGTVDGIEDITQVSDNRGNGGLTNFFWANGFTIKKKIHVGIKASYTFGSIDKESTISIAGTDVPINTISYRDHASYSSINFLLGFAYRYNISEKSFLNIGVTYAPKIDLNGTSELSLIRRSGTGGEIETQPVSNTKISQDFPQSFGIGLSYQRRNHYMIGLDIETQQWGNVGKNTDTYNNLFKIAMGINWVPDYDNVNSYFKRIKYSFGLNNTKLPYIVNDQDLFDFGINFGVSLPVSGFSSLDFVFKWGQLGETGNELIKESYYKIIVGATINSKWFVNRKYD